MAREDRSQVKVRSQLLEHLEVEEGTGRLHLLYRTFLTESQSRSLVRGKRCLTLGLSAPSRIQYSALSVLVNVKIHISFLRVVSPILVDTASSGHQALFRIWDTIRLCRVTDGLQNTTKV